jgi:hypothetical protein
MLPGMRRRILAGEDRERLERLRGFIVSFNMVIQTIILPISSSLLLLARQNEANQNL